MIQELGEALLGKAAGLLSDVRLSYVSVGQPAADVCGQLTVFLQELTQVQVNPSGVNQGGRAVNRYVQIPQFTYVVQYLGCVRAFTEDGEFPGQDVLRADHHAANEAAWDLYKGFIEEVRAGTLTEDVPSIDPHQIRLGALTPIVPSGNLGGYEFQVIMTTS